MKIPSFAWARAWGIVVVLGWLVPSVRGDLLLRPPTSQGSSEAAPVSEGVPDVNPFDLSGSAEKESQVGPVSSDILDERKIKRSMEASEKAIRSTDWNKALMEAEAGLAVDPENPQLLSQAASLAMLAKVYDRADTYLQRYLEIHPDSVSHLVARANIKLMRHDFEAAEKLVDKALDLNPKFLPGLVARVILQVANNDYSISNARWRNIALDNLLNMAKLLNEARDDLTEVLGEVGYGRLCDILLGEGSATHLPEIIPLVEKAMAANKARNWDITATCMQQLKVLGLRSLHLEMGVIRHLYETGRKDEAKRLALEVTSYFPDAGYAWYNYGYMLINDEQYPEATLALEKAHSIVSNDAQVAFALGCAYAVQGRKHQAWDLLFNLSKSHPREMTEWIRGDQPHLKVLQEDIWYAPLRTKLGMKNTAVPGAAPPDMENP